MSLVDPYHDRVFRNGRLYGVNYNEMTNQPTYTDISPFGAGGRKAGMGLDLEPDVVIYMGKAAQGMPQDQGMDVRIAEGMLKAMGRAIAPQLETMDWVHGRDKAKAGTMDWVHGRDKAEARTMEYVPSRDGPATPEILGPYNPDTDESGVELLAGFDMPADMSYPHIPGRKLEGVPNANDPVMREKLRNRRLKNPAGGEDLPGFLGRV